ncbi:MAG: hypothetical protein MRY79_00225 [Alphaproteobacteria bacterium]|nr:hypothetical protein [Alphaproteobacteria bacterium]
MNGVEALFRENVRPTNSRVPRKNSRKQAERALHQLENIALSVHSKINQTLSPRYIKPTEQEIAADPALETRDGLIDYREGTFRVAREPESGMEIILFEFEPHHLVGERNEKGEVILTGLENEKNPQVYVVDAFYNPSSRRKQLAIDEFRKHFHDKFAAEYSLFALEETPEGSFWDSDPAKKFRLANEDVAIGIYEDKEKQTWNSSVYRRLRRKGSFHFQQIGSAGTIRDYFSLGKEDEKFDDDNFDDLFRYYRRLWNINALKKFRGQDFQSSKKFKRGLQKIARTSANLLGKGGYTKYAVSGAVGLVGALVGLQAAVVSVPTLLAVLGGAALGNVVQSALEEVGNEGTEQFRRMISRQKADQTVAAHKRSYKFAVIDQSEQNLRRDFPKLKPHLLDKLVLLDTKESDLLQVDQKIYPVHQKDALAEFCKGRLMQEFGQTAIPINEKSLLSVLPSGLMAFSYIRNSTERVKYFTWREDEACSKRFNIPDQYKGQLEGKIVEIVRDENTPEQEINILSAEQFEEKLTGVFNDYASDFDVNDPDFVNQKRRELPGLITEFFSREAVQEEETGPVQRESVVDKIMQATLVDLRYEEKDPTKLLPQDKSKPSGWLSKLGW